MRLTATVLAVMALAGAAATAHAATTHSQYVGEVNPICKQGAQRSSHAIKKLRPSGDPLFDAYRAGRVFSKIFGRTIGQIAGVEPAPEDAGAVSGWIAGLRRQKRVIDRSLGAAKRGKLGKARSLAKRAAATELRNRQNAAALGLTECARASR